jgi:protoporphyrinogen/coproporphyrinogen III oxidase
MLYSGATGASSFMLSCRVVDDRGFDIAIVGAGITGLSAARAIEAALPEVRIVLLDRAERVGGLLQTEAHEGFVIDGGADSWVTQKPEASALALQLGLGGSLIGTEPTGRKVYTLRDRTLTPMPEGLAFGIPTRLRPFLRSSLFSPAAKLRIGMDLLLPRGPSNADESVGAFLERRLGREAKESLVGPLLGGIFSGEVDDLSLAATFPQLASAEREHRSLILALRKRAKLQASKKGEVARETRVQSTFTSLRLGMSELPVALAASLERTTIRLAEDALGLQREAEGYQLHTPRGPLTVRALFLANRVPGLSKLLSGTLQADFAQYRYGSAATVFVGYERSQVRHPLDGSGFIIPKHERKVIAAGTFVSSKWQGRAPAGKVLLRAFFAEPHAASADDAFLVQAAKAELSELLGIAGEALFAKVYRFRHASAQPKVGHLARVEESRRRLAATLPGVFVSGGGFDASGISDCIRAGTKVGQELAGYWRRQQTR